MATLLLILIYVAFISLGLPDALLGAVWPVMHVNLVVPLSYAGILQMIGSACTIISSMNAGKLLAKFGTGKVTTVSVGLTALGLFGFSLVPSFWWLLLVVIPLGLGAGAVDSGLNAFVAEHYESRHMSWLHSFWGLGALAGPLVLSFFLGQGLSWRKGYLSIAIFQAVLVFVLFISLPLWKKVRARSYEQSAVPDHIRLSLKEVFSVQGVPFALSTFFLYCGIEATMGLWSGSFLVNVKQLSSVSAARWVSSFYACITLGRMLTGFITFKIKNDDLIRWGALIILTGIVLMLGPLSIHFTIAGIMLVGLGCAPIFPCMIHETPNRFGSRYSQAIIGVQMAFAYIGTTFLPPLFGFVSSFLSLKLLPLFLLVYLVLLFFSVQRLRVIKAEGKL